MRRYQIQATANAGCYLTITVMCPANITQQTVNSVPLAVPCSPGYARDLRSYPSSHRRRRR
ncbi:MAG: hypothetical protein JO202_09805 [Ktedonobacteraceae bacterium]|nr:hypothetical protein [Ktedonobacteraceae bacterium]